MGTRFISTRILIYEAIAFATVIIFLWADELFDIQHNVFGTVATPVNWAEALVESSVVLLLGVAAVLLTRYYLERIKRMEGLLPVCAVCKRINEDGEWVSIERYVTEHSDADFTHSLCPECAKPYYEEIERLEKSRNSSRRGSGHT